MLCVRTAKELSNNKVFSLNWQQEQPCFEVRDNTRQGLINSSCMCSDIKQRCEGTPCPAVGWHGGIRSPGRHFLLAALLDQYPCMERAIRRRYQYITPVTLCSQHSHTWKFYHFTKIINSHREASSSSTIVFCSLVFCIFEGEKSMHALNLGCVKSISKPKRGEGCHRDDWAVTMTCICMPLAKSDFTCFYMYRLHD